jgi:hypothetical protein
MQRSTGSGSYSIASSAVASNLAFGCTLDEISHHN